MTPEEFRDSYVYDGPLEGTLGLLVEFYPERARSFYDAMVSSPDEEHRMRITSGVDEIIKQDFEYGYALWHRLLGDRSERVRRYAREILEEHLEERLDSDEIPNAHLVSSHLGQLNWLGACDLLRTFVGAEVDHIYFDLGPVVLSDTEAVPPNGPGPQAPNADPTVT